MPLQCQHTDVYAVFVVVVCVCVCVCATFHLSIFDMTAQAVDEETNSSSIIDAPTLKPSQNLQFPPLPLDGKASSMLT